jgi:Undecaprenyl-phosphate glucose phosphotransferase
MGSTFIKANPNGKPQDRISMQIVSMAMRIADAVAVVSSGLVCFWLYLGGSYWAELGSYSIAIGIGLVTQQNFFHLFGVYRPSNMLGMRHQSSRILAAWTLSLLVIVLFAFLSKTSDVFSRVWLILWFGSSLAAFAVARIALRANIKRWIARGRLDQNVIVVGGGEEGRQMIEYLRDSGPYLKIVGFVDDRTGDRVPGEILGVPKLGDTAELLEIARREPVDVIMIAMPWDAERRILSLVRRLWALPVNIQLAPQTIASRTLVHGGYRDFYGVPVLNLMDRPLNEWQKLAKALEDRILALLLIAAFAPLMLMLILAGLVKLESRGPVLFRQKRYGFNNRLIEVYKFRSMYAEKTDRDAENLAVPGDARITRVGRIMRMMSLDELPQLFNVLQGEMSIVGPRPHAVAAKAADRLYAEVVDEYAARHRIKPGITGWAQVNGWRGNTDTEEKLRKRIEYDLYYIDNWSIWFDLKILALTVVEVLRARNAY